MRVPFMKLQGTCNSFVILALEDCAADLDFSACARQWCSVGLGLGTDGLLVLGSAPSGKDASRPVYMFNPDGSLMGMCGNGIRCITRFEILRDGLDTGVWRNYEVEGRRISCRASDAGRWVEVNMGVPSFAPEVIPTARTLRNTPLMIEGIELPFLVSGVSMGNPHCVVMEVPPSLVGVLSIKELALTHGPALEIHPDFPKKANVEFVGILEPKLMQVAVWERGAGFTQACGTGACAAVVAHAREGRCDRSVRVRLPGGEVDVSWDENTDSVFLSGPVGDIARGELEYGDLIDPK